MTDPSEPERSPLAAPPPDTARDGDPDPTAGPSAASRRTRGCVLEIAQTLIATVAIFLFIQTFVARPFKVEQRSMETTYLDGDYVLVDRLSHLWSPYARGQVIVFQPPEPYGEGKPLIKRIIGVAGDTIELRDGVVYVNGQRLEEPYIHRDDAGVADATDPMGPASRWLVPADSLLVFGDHREVSSDSRVFGPVPVSSVIGRALLRYWPFDRFGLVGGSP